MSKKLKIDFIRCTQNSAVMSLVITVCVYLYKSQTNGLTNFPLYVIAFIFVFGLLFLGEYRSIKSSEKYDLRFDEEGIYQNQIFISWGDMLIEQDLKSFKQIFYVIKTKNDSNILIKFSFEDITYKSFYVLINEYSPIGHPLRDIAKANNAYFQKPLLALNPF